MAQLNLSLDIDLGNIPAGKQVNVKVAQRSSITARVSEFSWNDDDLYEDIEDFDVTDQSWRAIASIF